MKAADILTALQRYHWRAALIPEVTIGDDIADHSVRMSEGKVPVYTRRIDALMFDRLQRTAIEIKVTKADAARDTWVKTAPWQRVCHRFVYAVPAGLIDVPPVDGAGLWWVHDEGRVEVRRKAKPNPYPEPLPQSVVQILAFRAAGVLLNSGERVPPQPLPLFTTTPKEA